MNGSIKKLSNAVFRAVIFCCALAAIMMIVSIVRFALELEETNVLSEDVLDSLLQFTSIYTGLLYASAACVVLSILSGNYKSSSGAVVFRTILLGAVAYNLFKGLSVVKAVGESCTILKGFDVSDYEDVDEEMLLNAGVSEEKAQELVDAMQNDDAAAAMLIAIALCAAVYVLLCFTSLHNLLKKENKGADCGGCDDAKQLENYNPQMLNGGQHYTSPFDQNGRLVSNESSFLGSGIAAARAYQEIRQGQMNAHPAHDHHDSAEVHDMAADGEFTGYAQAEADIKDSGDDYVSELLEDEKKNGRITDDTFM